MKLSVSQKKRNKTVKFAVRTSGSKFEFITAGGTIFKALLLYQRTPSRYEVTIKWQSLETMCGMCWVRTLKFREFEQVLHRLVFRTYCKFERYNLHDILVYHVLECRHLFLWNTKLRFFVDNGYSFGGIFGHHLCGRILEGEHSSTTFVHIGQTTRRHIPREEKVKINYSSHRNCVFLTAAKVLNAHC